MTLAEHHSENALRGQDPAAVLARVRKDSQRRSARYEAIFDEVAKTLDILTKHRLLKEDVQFQGLMQALIGIEDADILHDRVLALVAYVNRVSEAHGVKLQAGISGPPDPVVLNQRPTHLADQDDDLLQRTRLQVR
ncbi:hypothetical protein [Yoonia sp. BS5-3]|uniref:Uncharacterized protein n=1 Tax=Yoonia phaeophyticola TaxID=3137369 RepID=A0ABZ2V4W6_9RHOB